MNTKIKPANLGARPRPRHFRGETGMARAITNVTCTTKAIWRKIWPAPKIL
jgi:hypothetical protein